MTPSSVFFFCLLVLVLPAKHGASPHTSYKLGHRQFYFKTSDRSSANSQNASTVPTAAGCSSLATGLGNYKIPIWHQQSPCSLLHGLPSLSAADVLRQDATFIHNHFSSQSSQAAALPPSPAATTTPTNGSALAPSPGATTIPTNGTSPAWRPGSLLYSVVVSYGTPAQQFPMFLRTGSTGTSFLRCKPCASGSGSCDPAFDTSRSSTFADILCGSPDCTTNCTGSGSCPLDGQFSVIDGTFAKDVLTLTPSVAIPDFKFFCLDVDKPSVMPVAGTLDLSRDENSLPSQLSSSLSTSGQAPASASAAAFSYCLPESPSSQGFLSLSVNATVRDNSITARAPLVSNGNPDMASMYFIDLVGMSLGDDDLSISSGSFGGDNGTILDVGTTFTMLAPDAYTALRDSFQQQMSQYNLSSPGIDGFDTCFNFTGLSDDDGLAIPNVQFKFSNGDSLVIDGDQMLYYDDPDTTPFTVACLAFSALDAGRAFSSVIGSYTLATTEVVYDVAGGTVGFIPHSC